MQKYRMTSVEFLREYLKLMKWNMKLLMVLKMMFWAKVFGILMVYGFFLSPDLPSSFSFCDPHTPLNVLLK